MLVVLEGGGDLVGVGDQPQASVFSAVGFLTDVSQGCEACGAAGQQAGTGSCKELGGMVERFRFGLGAVQLQDVAEDLHGDLAFGQESAGVDCGRQLVGEMAGAVRVAPLLGVATAGLLT